MRITLFCLWWCCSCMCNNLSASSCSLTPTHPSTDTHTRPCPTSSVLSFHFGSCWRTVSIHRPRNCAKHYCNVSATDDKIHNETRSHLISNKHDAEISAHPDDAIAPQLTQSRSPASRNCYFIQNSCRHAQIFRSDYLRRYAAAAAATLCCAA